MQSNQLLFLLICGIPLIIGTATLGVLLTLVRIRMDKQTDNLKARGLYKDWEHKNRAVLIFERTLIVLLCTSLTCIVIFPLFAPEIVRYALIPLIASGLLAPLSLYWHYKAVLKG